MLRPELVPTPLVRPAERREVEIAEAWAPRFRVASVLWRFARYGARRMGLKLVGRSDPAERARELREVIEGLGGLWVKVGQLVSLRTDVFSAELCEELSRLHYRMVGFDPAMARAIVEKDLDEPFDQVFERFEERPFAAASIAQVHRAVLRKKGRRVVVKVQRPGVDRIFARDMALIRFFVGILLRFKVAAHVQWEDALWELEQIALEETDFRYEASNLKRLKKSLKSHKVYVPKVFIRHGSRRTVVMEEIDGVLMSDFIDIGEKDPTRLAAWLAENDVDPEKVGRRLFMTAMRQLLEDNLFHADLHPGNIVLLRNNRVALIDLGSVGSLEKGFIELYKRAMSAVAAGDYERASDLNLRLANQLPPVDIPRLRTELIQAFRAWEARTHLPNLSYHEKSLASVGQVTGKIMYEHKVQLSWEFMKISRTWSTLDASLNFLLADVNYLELFRRYFKESAQRAKKQRNVVRDIGQVYGKTVDAVREYNLLFAPMLRQQALIFKATTTKVARVFALLYRSLTVGTVLTLGVATLFFLEQHHDDLIEFESPLVHEILDDIPPIDYLWWVGILGVLLVLVFVFRRMVRLLEQEEYDH